MNWTWPKVRQSGTGAGFNSCGISQRRQSFWKLPSVIMSPSDVDFLQDDGGTRFPSRWFPRRYRGNPAGSGPPPLTHPAGRILLWSKFKYLTSPVVTNYQHHKGCGSSLTT